MSHIPDERTRSVVDLLGEPWVLNEAQRLDTSSNTLRPCLIASTGRSVRRVWEFPEDWFNMTEENLREFVSGLSTHKRILPSKTEP